MVRFWGKENRAFGRAHGRTFIIDGLLCPDHRVPDLHLVSGFEFFTCFRVSKSTCRGFGFRGSAFGCRVSDFGVSGFRFGVWGVGSRCVIQNRICLYHRVPDFHSVSGIDFQVSNFQVSGFGFRVSGIGVWGSELVVKG